MNRNSIYCFVAIVILIGWSSIFIMVTPYPEHQFSPPTNQLSPSGSVTMTDEITTDSMVYSVVLKADFEVGKKECVIFNDDDVMMDARGALEFVLTSELIFWGNGDLEEFEKAVRNRLLSADTIFFHNLDIRFISFEIVKFTAIEEVEVITKKDVRKAKLELQQSQKEFEESTEALIKLIQNLSKRQTELNSRLERVVDQLETKNKH